MQPRIVVTGAAGFIGGQLIRALNRRGLTNIIAVDCRPIGISEYGLERLHFERFLEKDNFYHLIETFEFPKVDVIFHQGACSSTITRDEAGMISDNLVASKLLLQYCLKKDVRLIYASSAAVYGNAALCVEQECYEKPLNLYGVTKHDFDQEVRRYLHHKTPPQIVGLRYFNVFGPGEAHKGKMASIIYQHFKQLKRKKQAILFGKYGGFKAGEQYRDFVYIDNVIDVNLWFYDHPFKSGIYNVGTGIGKTFNAVTCVLISSMLRDGEIASDCGEFVRKRLIAYTPFPGFLEKHYQTHTQASLESLRQTGCDVKMISVEESIPRYVAYLEGQSLVEG